MKQTSLLVRSRSFLRLASLGLFAAAVFLLLPEPADARLLNTRDLRKLGFAGLYRGTVSGRVVYRQNNLPPLPLDQSRIVNTTLIERIPAKRTARVPGPLGLIGVGRSTFTLTHFPANGSQRRVTIRGSYSGNSTNTFYPGRLMVGSGPKLLRIVKRGKVNPRFLMTHRSTLYERRNDGAPYSLWSGTGRLEK